MFCFFLFFNYFKTTKNKILIEKTKKQKNKKTKNKKQKNKKTKKQKNKKTKIYITLLTFS